MQDNEPKDTTKLYQWYIKINEEQHVLRRHNKVTYIPLNLTKMSELNDQQVRLTSGNSCGKAGKNYFQSISRLWGKECWKSVKQ